MLGKNLIDGRFVETSDAFDVINPATGLIVGSAAASSAKHVNEAVDAARVSQASWRRLTTLERAGHLWDIAKRIRAEGDEFARLIATEQGKVMELAEGEVEFAASYFEYTAEWARRIEGEVITSDNAKEQIFLNFKPIGVVAGVLPWNFPFFLIARKMAPALLTGNSIVVKPSEETPLCALKFAELVQRSDLPNGVFNLVNGRGHEIGPVLCGHKDVGLVTFTGSVPTGRAIMRAAAENITKVNLELGGKAPVIVLADADLEMAVSSIVASRIINTGQVCNCAERVYVESSLHDEFVEMLAAAMKQVTYGDSIKSQDAGRTIDMGPLINEAAVSRIDGIVKSAIDDGAQLIEGGAVGETDPGYHYQPTVLANCDHEMSVMKDEVFGPVLPVKAVADLDEAIALANDSTLGLTSSIFTRNLNSTLHAMRELDFGETYVNREHMEAFQGFHAGVRQSGIGGADGKHGLYEFMQTHVTYIQEA